MRYAFLILTVVISISLLSFYPKSPVSPQPNEQIRSGYLNYNFHVDNQYFLSTQADTHHILAGIKAERFVSASTSRVPLNLCLVIDRSGSMSGDKLKYAKEAAKFLVDQLGTEDYLSIVTYENGVQVLAPTQKVQHKDHFHKLIASIETAGSTNLSGGLMEGYNQVKKNLKSGYLNRVLLMSDGLANMGIVEPMSIRALASTANMRDGISTSTFGVGADFNEDLMLGIAENGSGNYYFIQNPDEIPEIFKKELNGLLNVVAQNVNIEIEMPTGTRVIKAYGYEIVEKDGKQVAVLRDVSSEEEKTFLLTFITQPGINHPLEFKSTLTYDDAVGGLGHQEQSLLARMLPTDQPSLLDQFINDLVIREFAIFYANDILTRAMQLVDQRRYSDAQNLILTNEPMKKKYHKVIAEDKVYQKQDSVMTTYNAKIKDYEKMSTSDQKIMQKSSKSLNYSIQKKK